jgi:hypothetical protein
MTVECAGEVSGENGATYVCSAASATEDDHPAVRTATNTSNTCHHA